MFCLKCNSLGAPKKVTSGSIIIEFILWCCFLVPGLIYSVWRLTTRKKACGVCGSVDIVPDDSPAAQR